MRYFRQMKKITSVLLIAAMTAAMMAGCAAGTTNKSATAAEGTTTAEGTTAAESTTATEETTAAAITVTDAAGRVVTLQEPAKRIVSGYYITSSMLIALGLKDKVVGIEAKASSRPIYKLAAPGFLDLPNVGTAKEFSLETCASLSPDLVILPMKLSEQADILAGMGIAAMVVNPESAKELSETIENIAKLTGAESQADKLLTYYEEKTAELRKRAEDGKEQLKAQNKTQPKVYVAGTASVLRAATGQMYQNDLIEMAGGINAASDLTDKGWTNISYENLLVYNPDIILVIADAEYTKEEVLTDAQLKNVKAVEDGAVYEMPSSFEAWDSPVTSGILGGMYLSSIVNPEQYSFDEFKSDAAGFYKEFYDVEIDTSLITK